MSNDEIIKQEEQIKNVWSAARKQYWIFMICWLVFVLTCTILSFEILDYKTLVPAATAFGAGAVLVGSLGQAIDELGRAKESWRFIYPVPFPILLRLTLRLATPNRGSRQSVIREINDLKERIKGEHALIPHDEKMTLISEFTQAIRKARNWAIIVAGSACVLATSIYGAVSA
jgi:hypothetical protein